MGNPAHRSEASSEALIPGASESVRAGGQSSGAVVGVRDDRSPECVGYPGEYSCTLHAARGVEETSESDATSPARELAVAEGDGVVRPTDETDASVEGSNAAPDDGGTVAELLYHARNDDGGTRLVHSYVSMVEEVGGRDIGKRIPGVPRAVYTVYESREEVARCRATGGSGGEDSCTRCLVAVSAVSRVAGGHVEAAVAALLMVTPDEVTDESAGGRESRGARVHRDGAHNSGGDPINCNRSRRCDGDAMTVAEGTEGMVESASPIGEDAS